MVISKQNIYYFTVEIAYASYLIFNGFRSGTNAIGIYVYDNQTLLDSIPEHPFCDSLVSVNSSVHNIILLLSSPSCTELLEKWTSW